MDKINIIVTVPAWMDGEETTKNVPMSCDFPKDCNLCDIKEHCKQTRENKGD